MQMHWQREIMPFGGCACGFTWPTRRVRAFAGAPHWRQQRKSVTIVKVASAARLGLPCVSQCRTAGTTGQ